MDQRTGEMKPITYMLIGFAAGVLACAIIFPASGEREDPKEEREEATVVVVHDTIRAAMPIAEPGAKEVRKERARLAIAEPAEGAEEAGRDTATVEVPITQTVYRDTLYTAWVSGWRASLDSLEVYPRTVTKTITKTITQRQKPKRWGVGITAGATATPKGIQPGVSVGVTYAIWQW